MTRPSAIGPVDLFGRKEANRSINMRNHTGPRASRIRQREARAEGGAREAIGYPSVHNPEETCATEPPSVFLLPRSIRINPEARSGAPSVRWLIRLNNGDRQRQSFLSHPEVEAADASPA